MVLRGLGVLGLWLTLVGGVPVAGAAQGLRAAPSPGARLQFVQGRVEVNQQEGVRDQALHEGDLVVTTGDATAIVALENGSILKLRPHSKLQLIRTRAGNVEALLLAGGVFSKAEPLKPGQRFVIRTRTAVMGVRGTLFFTALGDRDDVWMCVNEGSVEVSASGSSKLVPQGKGLLLRAGREMTEPQVYDWTRQLNWNLDPQRGSTLDSVRFEVGYEKLIRKNYD